MFILKLMGIPETPREHVIKIFRMQREHRFEKIETTLQDLGITPTTYEQFVQGLAAGQAVGGNSFTPPETQVFKLINAMMPPMARLNLFFYKRAQPATS